jgi:hypothetical protein
VLPLALLWAWAGAALGAEDNVDVEVATVAASGRGPKPQFDPRIPAELKKQLEKSNLAYDDYKLTAKERKNIDFGSKASFPLPDSESLVVEPSPYNSRTHPVRLDIRILDKKSKKLMSSQLRVRYDRIFLLHRPKGASALIIGVSAHKP